MRCPNCHVELKFSDAHRQKISEALAKLGPGKGVRVTCPQCRQPFSLDDKTWQAVEGRQPAAPQPSPQPQPEAAPAIAPPPPPDLSWLSGGEFDREEAIEDIPVAMLLIPDEAQRQQVAATFTELGYQPLTFTSAEAAIERMRFAAIGAVVLHTAFEGRPLAEAAFHRHMCRMGMAQRRYIYYIIVGPKLHTLYDLEALSLSANLVVNERDLDYLDVIVRKGLADYEDLFGPYLAALQEYGKK